MLQDDHHQHLLIVKELSPSNYNARVLIVLLLTHVHYSWSSYSTLMVMYFSQVVKMYARPNVVMVTVTSCRLHVVVPD